MAIGTTQSFLYDFFYNKFVTVISSQVLRGQYYLILSLREYYKDTTKELNFALDQAIEVHNSREKISENILNLYYAGHIFLLQKEYKKANECFQIASQKEFLPAAYMEMLTYNLDNKIKERDDCMEVILHKERLIYESGKVNIGFLQGIVPQTIDIAEPVWNKPSKYAHSMEIQDAIQEIYLWLEAYEKQHGKLPSKWEFVNQIKSNDKPLVNSWLFVEKELRIQLEKYSAKQEEKDIEVTIAQLEKISSEEIPAFSPAETEHKLSIIIEKENNISELKKKYFLLLIKYYFLKQYISARDCIFLIVYIHYKAEFNKKDSFSLNVFEKFFNELIGLVTFPYRIFSILLKSVGAGFLKQAKEYVGSLPKDELISYEVFKN